MTDEAKFVMVPVKPTDEMLEAGDNCMKLDYDLAKIWAAMIAASPMTQPPYWRIER